MNIEGYHVPVMLNECLEGLQIRPDGIYVDVTFGGGGHSRAILSKLGPKGHLYSFDQDPDAEQNIGGTSENFTFVRSNFRYLKNWMRYYGVDHIDGLLADLGVSTPPAHLNTSPTINDATSCDGDVLLMIGINHRRTAI